MLMVTVMEMAIKYGNKSDPLTVAVTVVERRSNVCIIIVTEIFVTETFSCLTTLF